MALLYYIFNLHHYMDIMASYTKACSRCGYPIENGRYCKACMIEMAKELAGALDTDRKEKPIKDAAEKNTGARMHLNHRRRGGS